MIPVTDRYPLRVHPWLTLRHVSSGSHPDNQHSPSPPAPCCHSPYHTLHYNVLPRSLTPLTTGFQRSEDSLSRALAMTFGLFGIDAPHPLQQPLRIGHVCLRTTRPSAAGLTRSTRSASPALFLPRDRRSLIASRKRDVK